jgi:hypothetical protein
MDRVRKRVAAAVAVAGESKAREAQEAAGKVPTVR